VPVAAILVAGIRLRFLDLTGVRRDAGRRAFACGTTLRKVEEMGWFEHGSTIIVFAPPGFALCDGIRTGQTVRVGHKLLRAPTSPP